MTQFLSQLNVSRESFRGLVSEQVMALRDDDIRWQFGEETLSIAREYFLQNNGQDPRVQIGFVNDSSMTATWYRIPTDKDSYAIAISRGLIDAINLVAHDVFGQSMDEDESELSFGMCNSEVSRRVADRVAAFLEIGFPFGDTQFASGQRALFVKAIVEDALQFLVLHEFAHILLGHDRGDVHVLRNQTTDLQIATFSIGQEHQADRLAARLHASMRRKSAQNFPGMEFAGPVLLFGILGLLERYTRYQAAFDTPHAHPPAYERLYRLRVYYSSGDGHMYWSVPSKAGLQLARLDLDPHPESVQFSDAVAKSLLSAIEQVESAGTLRSPINELFNRLTSQEPSFSIKDECWKEICRWLYLGSPMKILRHLAEARANICVDLERSSEPEDRIFRERSKELIDDVLLRVSTVNDYTVSQAAKALELL